MNPQVGTAPVQNPFLQFLERQKSQGAPQAPGQNQPGITASAKQATNPVGATPAAPGGGQAPGVPGAQQPDVSQQDASMPGANPGITKNLLGAAAQLHQAIAQLTDPEEIRIVRTILILLQNLVVRDQQTQNANTGRFNPQAQQGGQPGGEGLPPTPPAGPGPTPPSPAGGPPVGGPGPGGI